uniref:Golgi integral membrane protein 4 n=1 Tax=Salvator merianae TaxID=96440 RepID=A0A8D0BPS1_SALMN
MGTGICSRRQKGLLQTGFCLVAMACLGSGIFFFSHLQEKVKSAEALALRYKQQQEALSGQLQVVYEHRSRLERSLQKERGEHKKTKEDFLVYKLEAQEALNKEKQDSMNKYGALSSQHKILKNQHEDIKKQLLDLQLQHNGLKLEHRKAIETHNQKYSQLQREKESEVMSFQDTIYKLREESKLLRKAHQNVHSQLLSAQAQMEEFRQLKETLQKMPSFKDVGIAKGQPKVKPNEQPPGQGDGPFQLARPKVPPGDEAKPRLHPLAQGTSPAGHLLAAEGSDPKLQGAEVFPKDKASHSNDGPPPPQGDAPFGQAALSWEDHLSPVALAQAGQRETPIVRFTRMVNSVQDANQDQKMAQKDHEGTMRSKETAPGFNAPSISEDARQISVQSHHDHTVQSWQDIVNKVNAQMDKEEAPRYPKSLHLGARPGQSLEKQQRGSELQQPDWEDRKGGMGEEELQMDAGMIEKEDRSHPQKEPAIRESLVPNDAADPAQDPNNQGEDEFEEAELERPDFEEKAGQADPLDETNRPDIAAAEEKIQKAAGGQKKIAEDLMDGYQEDEEQDLEDRGGEAEDTDGLQPVPEGDRRKEDYY